MVVVDDAGEVSEDTTVDALVGPGEVIAGGDGGVLGILRQQLALHIVDDGGGEEDAHGALGACQEVELLLVGHGCAALATGEDDGLATLGDGELGAQLGGGGEEGGDARGDVVVHTVGIEKGHLLLYGSEDAGVAGMETNNEVALVVVLLHQGALLVEGHVG